MAEHKYAQVLRLIAAGKNIVVVRPTDGSLHPVTAQEALADIARLWDTEHTQWKSYRLAPRTITINGREIEAPIDQIKSGEYCYCADSTGDVTAVRFDGEDFKHRGALACGRLFSTAEAARDAFSAFTLLLLQGDK